MKRKLFMWMMALAIIFSVPCLVSCDDDDDDKIETPDPDPDPEPEIKDELTAEESQKKIESSGLVVAQALKGIQNEPAIGALATLNALLTIEDENGYQNPDPNVNKAFSALLNEGSVTTFWELLEIDPESIGSYEWDAEKEKFVMTKEGKSFELKWPANETATSNNAVATLTYSAKNEPMPDAIDLKVKVAGSDALTAKFAATYSNEGMPTKVVETMSMGKYAFNTTAAITQEGLGAESVVKAAAAELISFKAQAVGFEMNNAMDGQQMLASIDSFKLSGAFGPDVQLYGKLNDFQKFYPAWSELNDDEDMISKEDQELYDLIQKRRSIEIDYSNQLEYLQQQQNEGNDVSQYIAAALEVIDAQIEARQAELEIEAEAARRKREAEQKENAEKLAALYNKHLDLKTISGTSLMGTVDFYVKEYKYGTNNEYTEYYVAPAFVFKDESRVDVDDFFTEENFPGLAAAIQQIMDAFKNIGGK